MDNIKSMSIKNKLAKNRFPEKIRNIEAKARKAETNETIQAKVKYVILIIYFINTVN